MSDLLQFCLVGLGLALAFLVLGPIALAIGNVAGKRIRARFSPTSNKDAPEIQKPERK
jgi:hypothetical protein